MENVARGGVWAEMLSNAREEHKEKIGRRTHSTQHTHVHHTVLTDDMEFLSRSSLLLKEEVSMKALLMISREMGILFWIERSSHS